MKRTLSFFIFISFSLLFKTVIGQDILWTKEPDNSSLLKGIKEMKIEFKYEIETVNGNQTEAEFVAEQKKDRNLKNSGMGDKWEKDWIKNRTFLFNPTFIDMFNKKMSGKYQLNDACEGCKYKMIVHVKALRTGKDNKVSTMIAQVPAGGNFVIDIVDESQKVASSFKIDNMNVMITPRNDDNFYPWINGSFSKLAKIVVTELQKNYK